MKIVLCCLAVMLLPFFATSQSVLPRELPFAPVLIRIPHPSDTNTALYGTGIYLALGNRVFLATAAHVLFDHKNGGGLINSNATIYSHVMGKDPSVRNELVLNLGKLQAKGLVKRHAAHDVAVVHIAVNLGGGRTAYVEDVITNTGLGVIINQIEGMAQGFSEVPEACETFVLGYPVSLFLDRSPAVDFESPLIRRGIVSQKNLKSRKLIIDSAVFGGNSGGPVFIAAPFSPNVTSFRLAGLIVEYVPALTKLAPQFGVTNSAYVNSGYSVAEPIDYVLELMKQ